MDMLGSGQVSSVQKKAGRWAEEDIDPQDTGLYESVLLSIRRVSESIVENRCFSHVVECKSTSLLTRPLPTQQKQFSLEVSDDPDGKVGALRFVLRADPLPAFVLNVDPLPAFRTFPFGTSVMSAQPWHAGSSCRFL